MKLATWNVNGIRKRQAELHEFIDREQPDVLCLQEIKASPDQLPIWLCDLEGYWCRWHGESGYSGVGLHIRHTLASERPAFFHPSFDYEQRIVTVRLPHATIASIYVPNGGKDFPAKMRFLEALDAYAAEFHAAGLPLVLCGDMNVARTIGQRQDERDLIERILSRGLIDVHRTIDPDNNDLFTWWAPWRNMRGRNIGWRLDHVFASEALAARATSCVVQREFGTSDHGPVIATFEM
jgi:exodeoxyribonuclease-3